MFKVLSIAILSYAAYVVIVKPFVSGLLSNEKKPSQGKASQKNTVIDIEYEEVD